MDVQGSFLVVANRESLVAVLREIVDAARPGTRIPPIDCTNNCGLGPCDCSGEWRVMDWAIDVPRLRQLLAEVEAE